MPIAAISLALALSGAGQAAATVSTKPAAEHRICRELGVTGSIMSTKVCRTRAQWADFDAAHERAVDNRRNSNTIDRSQGGAGRGVDSFGQ